MIEWTFVRINYHYMGLPFLCMLGSFRITGRLLHIFNPLPNRSAFIFSILQFLVRHWAFAVLKPSQGVHFHILSMRKKLHFYVHPLNDSIYFILSKCDLRFFIQNNQISVEGPSRIACCSLLHMSVSNNTSLTIQHAITDKCEGHVLMMLS